MRQIAHFPSVHATQYVATMAKHFGHKIAVETSGDTALMRFEAGTGLLQAQADGIAITVEATNQEDALMLADVVERHLLRFAHREDPTALIWVAA